MSKITDYTALDSPQTDDVLVIVDVHDDTQSAEGTTKKVTLANLGYAPLASPALTGTPTAPTASALTDSTQVATTAYADAAVATETSRAETAEALKLAKASNLSDVGTRQTALNNLAGAVTSGEFLRGNGSNVQMGAIQAADLPYLPGRPGTLVVAASGASAVWKAYADYVCTGTSDQTQINEALAALPSTGGTVLLSDGTFTISAPVIPTVNASVLRGQGTNATIIKTATGSNCNGYQYSQSSQSYNLIFCSIQSLTFYGNYNAGAGDTSGYGCYINYSIGGGSNYTFWDFYLRDVWFENWPQDGFYATGGHGYVLDHCLAEYNGGNGINFAATTDETDTPPRIVNGTYKLNGGDGIICNVDGGYIGANEISNNTGDGLSLGGLTGIAIGNFIKLNTGTGIILTNTGARATGNYITNNHANGIHITGGHEGGSAVGNTIAYNGLHGILSDNVRSVISSNYLLSNSYSGNGGTTNAADEVNVTTGTFNGLENLIIGNMINCASSSRYGINFAASGDTQGVALANTILGAATASVNSAAPDTCFIGTGPYQASTLPRSVSGTYTAAVNDNVILMTATGHTVTLPTAVGITGRQYTIKLTASGTCTVATTSSQTIDGATTYSLASQYSYVTVVSDGSNWQIVAAFAASSASPLPLASGGTGLSAASDSGLLTSLGALASANNLSDVASTATAVANLGAAAQGAAAGGLGTAALGQAIMSLPVALINVNVNSVAEFLYMILCTAEFTKTINTLGCYIQIAGITTGTGVNGLAIYSEAGSKLGVTGDMTTQFETLGNAEGTLGSGVAITAGTNYYLCFLHNFTGTVPKPVGYTALTLTTGDPLVGTHYPALTYGSQASFPTSVTPSSGTGTANHFWIYGR